MFKKGQSGNPAGPAKGTRHKITMLAARCDWPCTASTAKSIVSAMGTIAIAMLQMPSDGLSTHPPDPLAFPRFDHAIPVIICRRNQTGGRRI